MNGYQDDEALARLRSADPATGSHPDLHKMSARLRGRTPLGHSQSGGFHEGVYRPAAGRDHHGSSATDASSTAVHVPDPGVHTRRSGLLVAASVAAVALGGGGYAVGAYTADGGSGGGATVASSTESADGRTADNGGSSDAAGPEELGLTAEDDASAGVERGYGGDDAMAASEGGGYAGPTIPVAGEGLSTERTTGPVHAVSMGDTVDAPQVLRQYADGLGIEGEVTDDGSTMSSVADSTDGRMLNVYSFAGLSIDYSNPALDSYCEQMLADMAEGGGGWFGPGGPTEIECVPLGELPDDETAIASVQEFLGQAGVDYSGLEFSVDSYDGYITYGAGDEASSTGVLEGDGATSDVGDEAATTAAPEVDSEVDSELVDPEGYQGMVDEGMTDISVTVTDPQSPVPGYRPWHFTVTSGGVAYGSVQLGDYTELGDYEVISPAEAVERANDTRFQQMGAYIPDMEYTYPADEWVEPTPLPPVSPGEPIPFPLSESKVTDIELRTGVIGLWDGTEFLVPVYALSDGQGNYWEVLGLAEEALDFSP